MKIELGSIVSVNFNSAQYTLSKRAKVICIPSGPGDTWGFEDLDTGITHYVSEGCTITINPKDQSDKDNRNLISELNNYKDAWMDATEQINLTQTENNFLRMIMMLHLMGMWWFRDSNYKNGV